MKRILKRLELRHDQLLLDLFNRQVAMFVIVKNLHQPIIGNMPVDNWVTLIKVVILGRFIAKPIGHHEMNPRPIQERIIPDSIIATSGVFIELKCENHWAAASISHHSIRLLPGRVKARRQIEPLAEIHALSSGIDIGHFKTDIGTMIKHRHGNVPPFRWQTECKSSITIREESVLSTG